jgi:hypothetical protein
MSPAWKTPHGRDIASQHPPDIIEGGYFQGLMNAPMMMPMTLTPRLVFESLPDCHHLIWLVDATC